METKEKNFEQDIETYLLNEGGYVKGTMATYDKKRAIDMPVLIQFIEATQPKQWARYKNIYGEQAENQLYKMFQNNVAQSGLIYVLRNGIKDRGIGLKFVYFEPASGLNEELVEKYNANILTETRQFFYSTDNHNSVDMVLSVNGIPVVALELKNQFTGQTVDNSKHQYMYDRDPKEPLFQFNNRILAFFGVDLEEVVMTTHLQGDKTFFLPFNQGSNGAGNIGDGGNPENPDGYPTSYLWERVLRRDMLLSLLQRYISLQEETKVKLVNGKKVTMKSKKIIFPRYHQLDVVEKLIADTKVCTEGKSFLLQHSAGSGKSNSIAWLTYRLSSLHNKEDKEMFQSVFVVTDRRILNNQLQDTILGFDHKQGQIETITDSDNSSKLKDAINDKKRIIKPPTTAATLNLAACAAQSARLWKKLDGEFADKCLAAAEKAYEAAKKHPDMYAPLDESVGGGAYGDNDVTDEFYWAAMELYVATEKDNYLKDAEKSDYFMEVPVTLGGGESVDTVGTFDWGNTAALGTFTALLNSGSFDDVSKAEKSLTEAADHYLELENGQGFGLPYGQSTLSYNDKDKGYLWGSNSFVADNAIVLAFAAVMNDDESYTDGALQGLDYLLGRNAMDYSYVTGYGTHTTENPHHRWWSNQIDDAFPKAPCGVLSGGPNSGMQDPWVRGMGWKKGEIAPQKCYVDHVEAWCVNECTINWNASLAWLTAFSALNAEIKPGEGGKDIGVENNGGGAKSTDKSTYDEEKAEENAAKSGKSAKSKASAKDADDENGEGISSTKLVVIIVAAVAVLILIIATYVFIFEMTKLKRQDPNKPQ